MEREKGRERITTSCEYERESCPKIVKKWLSKYHFSYKKSGQRNQASNMHNAFIDTNDCHVIHVVQVH
jgi:hypothetical protein